MIKVHTENFQESVVIVTKSWNKIANNLEDFREKIAEDYFQKEEARSHIFRKTIDEESREENPEENKKENEENDEENDEENEEENSEMEKEKTKFVQKKIYKHSVAVMNWLEIIVSFINGNEVAKPIFYVMGRQHRHEYVTQKLFINLQDSICGIIEKELGTEHSEAWRMILEYILVSYVFPGMDMIDKSL